MKCFLFINKYVYLSKNMFIYQQICYSGAGSFGANKLMRENLGITIFKKKTKSNFKKN